MKILVFGAGVLGSMYAAKLKEAGHDVKILARGGRLEQVRAHGLVLADAARRPLSVVPVEVVDRLEPEDSYDWILVLVRMNQLDSVLPALATNKNSPNILFLLNNPAGPEGVLRQLAAERVVLGFPGAGGSRGRMIVEYRISPRSAQPTTIGELDGSITPRLHQIAATLEDAGLPVAFCNNMDAWLKTHAALVSPIANAIYLAGGSTARLAHTRDGLVLLVRSVRENLAVLRALKVPITPTKYNLLSWLPEPLLVLLLRLGLPGKRPELLMASHANAARDEMKAMADELRSLAHRSGVPTPANDELYAFVDQQHLPLMEGSARLPLVWRGVVVAAVTGILTGLAGALLLGRRKPTST